VDRVDSQGTLVALTPSELVLLDPDAFSNIMIMNPQSGYLGAMYADNFIEFLKNLDRSACIDIIRKPFSFHFVKSSNHEWKKKLTRSANCKNSSLFD